MQCDLDPGFFGATLVAVLWLLSGKSGGPHMRCCRARPRCVPTCSRWGTGTLEPGWVGLGSPYNCWCHSVFLPFHRCLLWVVLRQLLVYALGSFLDSLQGWLGFSNFFSRPVSAMNVLLWWGKMRWSYCGLINYLLVVSAPKVISKSLLYHQSYSFG
jgi:hypothetical protein